MATSSVPARRDIETEWLNPIYDESAPDDQTLVYMPTADLGYTAPRFRWRHVLTRAAGLAGNWGTGGSEVTLLGSGLVAWPGGGIDITYDKFDGYVRLMIYEGADPLHPDYIYMRTKVFLQVQTETDSLGIGGIGINNSASIPKQVSIVTSVINNAPTEFYEKDPDVIEPEDWVADPDNPVYKYTTYNSNSPTPFAEEGGFYDYDGDYSGGGGSYIMHWFSVWYDIEIPPSAKFYCPNDRLWDQWQVPTPLNPKRLQFQFEVGSSDIDAVLGQYSERFMSVLSGKGVAILGGDARGSLEQRYFFANNSSPSISYDNKERIWVGLKNVNGYYEYFSEDSCRTFWSVQKIWNKEYTNPKHIFVPELGIRASIAVLGTSLLFWRSDVLGTVLIKNLTKADKYSLTFRKNTGDFQVMNSLGQGFFSHLGGKVWMEASNAITSVTAGTNNSTKRILMSKILYLPVQGITVTLYLEGKNLLFKRSDNTNPILIKTLEKAEPYALAYQESSGALIVANAAGQGFYSQDVGKTWTNPDGTSAIGESV